MQKLLFKISIYYLDKKKKMYQDKGVEQKKNILGCFFQLPYLQILYVFGKFGILMILN